MLYFAEYNQHKINPVRTNFPTVKDLNVGDYPKKIAPPCSRQASKDIFSHNVDFIVQYMPS
jgi:hypothetical protein